MKYTATAYFYPAWDSLEAAIKRGPFIAIGDVPQDAVAIGTAEVVVKPYSQDAIVQGQIATLKAQLAKERAESQVRQNMILDQISKLQALEWSAA